MPDLAAISARVTSALADAEAHGAMLAAEVLRVDAVALIRLARHAEPHPDPAASVQTDAITRAHREHA